MLSFPPPWSAPVAGAPELELLGEAGPAQTELLVHFCGRPFGRAHTPSVPDDVRAMNAETRLHWISGTVLHWRRSSQAGSTTRSRGPLRLSRA